MILFNHELLFVHNPKTAGTSLLDYLSRRLAGQVHQAGVRDIGTNHPSLERALTHACAVTGNRPDQFRRLIGVVRDPYDREVSMYLYYRDVLASSPSLARDLNDPLMERNVRMAARLPFGDYLAWLWSEHGTCDIWHSRGFYRMSDGLKPASLCVLKVERLKQDIADALNGLELLESGPIPRLNTSQREATDSYYDERSADLVTASYDWMFVEGYYRPRRFVGQRLVAVAEAD